MQEQETILSLLRLGWSIRRVARETGHRRETIARYARAAGLVGPTPIAGSKSATESAEAADSKPGVAADVGSKPATGTEVPTDSRPGTEADVGSQSAIETEVPTGSKPGTEADVSSQSAIETEVSTGSAAAMPAKSRSTCEGHRPFIEAEVAKGRNGVAIFQDLVELLAAE